MNTRKIAEPGELDPSTELYCEILEYFHRRNKRPFKNRFPQHLSVYNRLLNVELENNRCNNECSIKVEDDAHYKIPSWCQCGHCTFQKTARESFCCKECSNSEEPFSKNVAAHSAEFLCITDNPQFAKFCQDTEVVALSAEQYAAYHKQKPKKPFENRFLRNAAYRNFTFWIHGRMGAKKRLEIPSCTVALIRKVFPNEEYTGFSEVAESFEWTDEES